MPTPNNIRLTFKQQHRSVSNLPDVSLPPFTVVTGVNGSGKTHLLEAIQEGKVVVEGVSSEKSEIRRFDWASFSPKVEESANPAGMRQLRDNALRSLIGLKDGARNSLRALLKQSGIES